MSIEIFTDTSLTYDKINCLSKWLQIDFAFGNYETVSRTFLCSINKNKLNDT